MKTKPVFAQTQTLIEQVTGILRRGLKEGLWTDVLPGELELSRTLRVSRMTLRASLAALTTEGLLATSQGRKRRILGSPAPVRKRSPTQLIVVLTAVPIELLSVMHSLVVEALKERLAKAGFALDVHVSPKGFSGKPDLALEQLVAQRRATAWILINGSASMQRWFMYRQLPCVIIGMAHPEITIPSIGTDYAALGRHAAGLFLRRGHRHLAVILPNDGKAGHLKTEAGFRAASALVEGASVQVINHNGQPEIIARAVTTMLKHSPATGYLVALPQFVLTVISAFAVAKIQMPRDVSLISRDSDPYLDFMIPSIARYAIDVPQSVKKILQAVLLVSRGSMPHVRAQYLQRHFIRGDTLGDVASSV